MMKFIAITAALAMVCPAHADAENRPRLELYYSPEDNLEKVDASLIDSAARTIDIAAYVLTDVPVIDALTRAAVRGVQVRLFREPMQMREFRGNAVDAALVTMLQTPGIVARDNPRHVWMHLKSYMIDGRVLRMGAANFSASGLKQQDNDLLITDDAALVSRFKSHFEAMWERGK